MTLALFLLYLLQLQSNKYTMTKEEFAKMIDGRDGYGLLTADDALDATQYDLVIIYGVSDDLVEFEGAMNDELGAWGGGTFYYDNEMESFMDIEDSFEGLDLENALTIQADWRKTELDGEIVPWTFQTNIPHATFKMMSSDHSSVFCVGLVIDINDLTK